MVRSAEHFRPPYINMKVGAKASRGDEHAKRVWIYNWGITGSPAGLGLRPESYQHFNVMFLRVLVCFFSIFRIGGKGRGSDNEWDKNWLG